MNRQLTPFLFCQLEDFIAEIEGIPRSASRPLAAALFMYAPLPREWSEAASKLTDLLFVTNNPGVVAIVRRFNAIYAAERDRVYRTLGRSSFGRHAAFRQPPQDGKDRRSHFVYLGVEILRLVGLPLESSSATAPTAFGLMSRLLNAAWPHGAAHVDPDSVKRAYYRGKKDYKAAKFRFFRKDESGHEQFTSYPTSQEFINTIVALYPPDALIWLQVDARIGASRGKVKMG